MIALFLCLCCYEESSGEVYITKDNANGCENPLTLQTNGFPVKFPVGQKQYVKYLYQTGPFASNGHKGRSFSTQSIAITGTKNPTIVSLKSITPFVDSDVCSGIGWKYGSASDTTNTPGGVPESEKGAEETIPLPISSISGCLDKTINSLSYNASIGPVATCGSSTAGIGFNAYPLDKATNACKFVFWKGTSETQNDVNLTNMFFIWQCDH